MASFIQQRRADLAYARKSGRMSQFRHPGHGLINWNRLRAARQRAEARAKGKSGKSAKGSRG